VADPFYSAKCKLAWAKEHIAKLEWEIQNFLEQPPCETFTEPHPQKYGHTVQKIRLARLLPPQIPMIAGDAVDNLRAVLDHAVFAVAIAGGCGHPRNAYFPFSATAAGFEANLKGRSADVPQQIWPLFRSFQPYKGGNDLLVALKEACNRNKHALIVSVIVIADVVSTKIHGTGGFLGVPTQHVWDRAKNEMELFTEGPGAERDARFDLRFLITFAEIPGADTEQASTVLYTFAVEVERILCAIEAESRRLGFIP